MRTAAPVAASPSAAAPGATFGTWTGGTNTVGAGNLTFAGGNTILDDDVSVDGGAGTVTNSDPLRLLTSHAINGSFVQTALGVLDLELAGTATGQYGALTFTSPAATVTLDGILALDLVSGFTLASGDVFDFLSGFSGLSGAFTGVTLDGAACSARPGDVWTCAGGFDLTEGGGADVFALSVSASGGGGGAVPEASTWAMLLSGFAGLGGLMRERRRMSAPA